MQLVPLVCSQRSGGTGTNCRMEPCVCLPTWRNMDPFLNMERKCVWFPCRVVEPYILRFPRGLCSSSLQETLKSIHKRHTANFVGCKTPRWIFPSHFMSVGFKAFMVPGHSSSAHGLPLQVMSSIVNSVGRSPMTHGDLTSGTDRGHCSLPP